VLDLKLHFMGQGEEIIHVALGELLHGKYITMMKCRMMTVNNNWWYIDAWECMTTGRQC